MAALDPDVVEFQRELAMSHNNFGALLAQTGEPDLARGSFGQALQIQQKLADANPGVAELQRDVAMSHNNIGAMLSRTGDQAGRGRRASGHWPSSRNWRMPIPA